jgi:hypothetical protein
MLSTVTSHPAQAAAARNPVTECSRPSGASVANRDHRTPRLEEDAMTDMATVIELDRLSRQADRSERA